MLMVESLIFKVTNRSKESSKMMCRGKVRVAEAMIGAAMLLGLVAIIPSPLAAQNDPAEPLQGKPNPKVLPRPSGAVMRREVDENSMRMLIERMVACGTRHSMSSWEDPN